MSDMALRGVLIAAAVGVVVTVALMGRLLDRRRAGRTPLSLDGLTDPVLFFSDTACHRCDIVRARLVATGVAFKEVGYRDAPETHRRVGVTAVPLLVVRRPGEVIQLAGVASTRRIARAVLGHPHQITPL